MTDRLMTNPDFSTNAHGDGVAIRFRVPGSRFGNVDVELTAGDALTLISEILGSVAEHVTGEPA